MEKRSRKTMHRIFAAFLCFCILFTLPGISDILPVVAAGQEESDKIDNIIMGFYPLPEEVKDKTVSVGTNYDALNLPDELTVYLKCGQESAAQKAEESEQEDAESENTEETADNIVHEYIEETVNIDNGERQDTESEEGTASDEADVQEEVTEDTANTESDEDKDEEGVSADEQKEDEATQETYIVTLPEYQAGNVISVETLENTQETENVTETTVTISGITWQSAPEYNRNTEGTYIFTAVLPDNYTLAEGVSLPQITVTVQECIIESFLQALLDRIAVLPDVEEYLAAEPDMADEEAYAEWEEKLYEYAEEALAIWEEYEGLTEEQQVQISETELAKLVAWVELTEQLSENNMIMLADSEHHTDWTALTTNDTALSGGNYYLANDITMETIVITGEVTLCLNGHTLTHSGDTGSVIEVQSGIFTLCDCEDHWDYTSSFDENTKTYTCEVIGTGGSLTGGMGKVDGSNVLGGGVYVSSDAQFNMISGRITGCDLRPEVNHDGGGVYVAGGEFNMSGGFIDGNTANNGGGVYLASKSKFKMSGDAVIMNNKGEGGGVYCYASGTNESNIITFTMDSGKILGNQSDAYGGGIFIGRLNIFNMTGGVIEGNSTTSERRMAAGGIYAATATVNLSGGRIQHNIAQGEAAGGIRAYLQTKIYISGSIYISDNYVNEKEENVSLSREDCPIVVTGKLSNYIGVTYKLGNGEPTYPVKIAEGTTTYSITNDDWGYFSHDDEEIEILMKETDTGNELYLAVPGSCDLGGLSLSAAGATLSPTFDADITEYTATVTGSDKVGITATLAETVTDAGITIKINGGTETLMTSGEETEVFLETGSNTIEITVTSAEMSKTYTLVITREEAKGNPVTITAYKDGAAWTDNPPDFKLSSDNGTTFVTDLTAVPDGTYHIYDGDTDTKATVTVNGMEASARVDYYTVTFYDKDVELTTPAQQTVISGLTASAPADNLTKDGYTFSKWVTTEGGSTAYNFAAAVTKKTLVYASWTPVTYTITYNLDGGTVTGNPGNYTIESNAIILNNPMKEGYTFAGWSGTDLTENSTSVTIAAGSTGNRSYTAHWTNADYTVTLYTNGGSSGTTLTSYQYGTGAVLPTDWTKTGYTFGGWYDNENCTGTAVTTITAADTGNKEYWAKWTDNIAPIIGSLQYSYQPKNFWQWLIGKDSLIITVPVTEEGSGADDITYTVMPEGGTASNKTSAIENGTAEITVSADFKGTITITCTDKDGNTSSSVTVGKDLNENAKGIIIEDNAPQIEFDLENSTKLETGEYEEVSDIIVTVTDNKDNAISAGIASVSYQIGSGSAKTVDHDYATSMVVNDSFTIPASEIPSGETVITVTATDNARNSITITETIKVHTHSGTLVPEKPATCTEAGNNAYYICACGKRFSDSGCTAGITDEASVVIAALGHDFSSEYATDKEASCTEAGSKSQHCSRCDAKQNVTEIAATGHTAGESKEENRKEATCTEDGSYDTVVYCSVCGDELSRETHTIEKTGHSFGEWETVVSPNCTDKGSRKRTCEICRYVETEEVNAAGHSWEADYTVDKVASCTESGSRSIHCSKCDAVKDSEVIPMTAHTPVTDAAKAATCTETGLTEGNHCSVCNTVLVAQTEVAAFGHDLSGEYQFDENEHWQVCSRCNETQPKESHVFDDDNDTICNKCGYQRTIGTHTHSVLRTVAAKEATCTTAGNKAYYICSCGKWFSDNACTKEVMAQDIIIAAKGHDFSGDYEHDAEVHWKVCSRCGVNDTPHEHRYDNNRDADCNDCGYKRKIDNPGTDQKDDSDDEQPPSPTNPPEQSKPANPPEQSQPTEPPKTEPNIPDNRQPEDDKEPESTEKPELTEKPAETEKAPEEITESDEPIQTGNVKGMTSTSTVLNVGSGAIIVTVECKDQVYTAGVADTAAVANAVLTQEQLALVNNGESIEIRIEVKDISDSVPQQDREVIENGIEEYRKEIPGLTLGMYVDVSMFIKIGADDWNAITKTREPIEVIIGVPDTLQEKGRTYYIIRSHEGEYTFMSDMDSEQNTITISTDMFSSYAVAYVQADGEENKCGLCHICPTFLGICYFIWLAIIIVIIMIIWIVIRKKRKE